MKKKHVGKQKYQYIGVQSRSVRIKENDLWGINSFEGDELLSIDYLEVFTLPSGFGLIAARKEGSWSLFDNKGNKISSDTYDHIHPYYGLFSVSKVRIGNKWGLINKYGEKVTPIQYKGIERFGKGLVRRKFDSDVDFVDHDSLLHFNNISTNVGLNALKESKHQSVNTLRKKKIKTS